jgi:hypothetical protein
MPSDIIRTGSPLWHQVRKISCGYNARMQKRVFLIFWLIGIIFPMAWLGRLSSRYHSLFDALFSPEWIHRLMHAVIFSGLIVLLMLAFDLEPSRKTMGLILLVALIVGILQESLQLYSGVQVLRWNTLLDLSVDSAGALVGYSLIWGIAKLREEKVSSRSEF